MRESNNEVPFYSFTDVTPNISAVLFGNINDITDYEFVLIIFSSASTIEI